jgi:hypothetical protein
MRSKVFFAENNTGVKLSFTRLSLKKALENINKKSPNDEFTIIEYIIVKKPKVVRDIIAKSILDKKIENTDLYEITDFEIKEMIEYAREFFNTKIPKNLNEDYDSDNKEFEEYDSENDPEYIPPDDEVIAEEEESLEEDAPEEDSSEEALLEEDVPEEDSSEEAPLEEDVPEEPEPEPEEESNKLIFIDEKGSTIEQSSNIFNSIYYFVKDILVIYGASIILYKIYNYLSN